MVALFAWPRGIDFLLWPCLSVARKRKLRLKENIATLKQTIKRGNLLQRKDD
jgi:hypothetical protein